MDVAPASRRVLRQLILIRAAPISVLNRDQTAYLTRFQIQFTICAWGEIIFVFGASVVVFKFAHRKIDQVISWLQWLVTGWIAGGSQSEIARF